MVRLLDLWVGGAVTSVTCVTGTATTEQEISPLGRCLAGVAGEESAALHVRTDGRTLRVIPLGGRGLASGPGR